MSRYNGNALILNSIFLESFARLTTENFDFEFERTYHFAWCKSIFSSKKIVSKDEKSLCIMSCSKEEKWNLRNSSPQLFFHVERLRMFRDRNSRSRKFSKAKTSFSRKIFSHLLNGREINWQKKGKKSLSGQRKVYLSQFVSSGGKKST